MMMQNLLAIPNHPMYTRTVKGLGKTVVRDKLMRMIQYFSRFLAYWAFRKGYAGTIVTRFRLLHKQVSMARKLLRIGRPLENLEMIAREIKNRNPEPLLHALSLIRNTSFVAFFISDFFVWLHSSGVYRFSPTTGISLGRSQQRMWAIALIAGLGEGLFKLYHANHTITTLLMSRDEDKDKLKRTEEARKKALKLVVWRSLDLVIPLSTLGYLQFDDGILGICGVITAYLGFRQEF